ncbi:hypothetical protein YYC_05810 [Plasmodium yoelii 17X]|uniref:Uncharacterized protein n=2 Tax=Plasmodium yoelii TaxID=5861 RepID=Q7RSI1_PLAYO|nr:hypothetical protein [Plasmodium yoelii yoelii]ETB56381.1 hypothetical protein YYC_05810 [Plasmodium yoelii 17X]
MYTILRINKHNIFVHECFKPISIFPCFIVFKLSILEHMYYLVKTLYLNYIFVNLYIYNLIKILLIQIKLIITFLFYIICINI